MTTTHIYQGRMHNLEEFPVVLWGRFVSSDWSEEETTTDLKTAAYSYGIASIVRTGAGVFRVTTTSKYAKVLSVSINGAAALYCYVSDDSVSESTPYFDITCAADPTDAATVLLRVELRN